MAAVAWTDPGWLARADWIDRELERLGRPRTGAIEQPHALAWATALKVPTAQGPVWLKASIPALAHEAGVVRVLVRRRPQLLPALLAAEPDRGWMLLEDAGERLRELLGDDQEEVLRRWEEVLPLYADLQRAVAGDIAELLAAGAPDRRLGSLAAQYAELVERAAVLPGPEPLSADELEDLRGLAPRVAEQCGELAAAGFSETIQHDDLHDGQVFVRDGRYLVLDWGDACVSHPFCTLTVTLNAVAYRLGIERDAPPLQRIRDAYLDTWPGQPAELRRAFEAADRLGRVSRALSWAALVDALPAEQAFEQADAVTGWLRLILETTR